MELMCFYRTFFGGSDDTWATPAETYTYYRNIQLWGSDKPSTLSGEQVRDSATNVWGSVSKTLVLCSISLVVYRLL